MSAYNSHLMPAEICQPHIADLRADESHELALLSFCQYFLMIDGNSYLEGRLFFQTRAPTSY